jgi:hypothetical protein
MVLRLAPRLSMASCTMAIRSATSKCTRRFSRAGCVVRY